MNVLQVLQQLLGSSKKLSNGEYLFFCPLCKHHKRKLQVNVEKQLFNCWVCKYKSRSFNSFIKKVFPHRSDLLIKDKIDQRKYEADYSNNDYSDSSFRQQLISLPNDYRKLSLKSKDPDNKTALSYLQNRGITWKHIEKYQIGINKDREELQVIVPSFDDLNNLNYYVSRIVYGSQLKYRNPPLNRTSIIPFESTINFNYSITIVEGIFDAIKINHNAIPLLGSSIGENWALYKKLLTYCNSSKKIYLCLDNDDAGRIGLINISKLFLKNDVAIYYIDISPFKDVGEMKKKDFLIKRRIATLIDEFFIREVEIETC